jgi:hypothetical protein
MADTIAELRELMESYRHRSKAVPFRPVADAYAEAADNLEEMISQRSSHRTDQDRFERPS